MSLSANKIILANASTNTAAAYYEATTLNVVTTGTTVPAGIWQLIPQANLSSGTVVIQFNTSTNIASPTWVTISSGNAASLFISDGTNVQANCASNVVITLYGPNGGQNVSGTFNNK
jgi:hypothetical protein